MTKVLKLALLGQMRLYKGDEPLTELASAKAQALLCYLAVNGRSYSRQSLAGLLWSELPEADARRNLRGVLMRLRQTVNPYLTITHQFVAFNRASNYWLDVVEFGRIVTQKSDAAQLRTAVNMYRGDFLEEFHVRQAAMFETWVMQQRAELRDLAGSAYLALAVHHAKQGEYEQGIADARRLLALDPVGEKGHRQLMRLLTLNGQRSAALAHYEACRQILADELGVEPAAATAALYEEIKSGGWQVAGGTPSSLRTASEKLPNQQYVSSVQRQSSTRQHRPEHIIGHQLFIAGPPVSHPRQFFGRQREVKRIFNLLQRLPLQNAAIIGERRSGKTSLLHYLKAITTTPSPQLRPDQQTEWLPQPDRYRWIFVDFQDSRWGQAGNLLRYLLAQMELPCEGSCDLDTFLDIVSDNLDSPTVILFDEIGVALERYPELDDAFWESLRSLATNQVGGNLAFVLAAHESPAELAQHSGLGSPFFNIFGYTAVLGPFTETEARELIASSPIPFPDADVDWILQESGRWPMPLQILCRERLISLEDNEDGEAWRDDALRQIAMSN